MSKKILFFDLETTGTNPSKHSIHQISGKIFINGRLEDEFDIHMQPNPTAIIDDEALSVSGVTREQLATYMPFSEGYRAFLGHIAKYVNKYDRSDKMFLAGYNVAAFDVPFLRGLFLQNGDTYFGSWFWSVPIDVIVLAQTLLMDERNGMENFKQGTVAKYLGIEVDDSKLHDALYDIEICHKIYQEVMLRMRNPDTDGKASFVFYPSDVIPIDGTGALVIDNTKWLYVIDGQKRLVGKFNLTALGLESVNTYEDFLKSFSPVHYDYEK